MASRADGGHRCLVGPFYAGKTKGGYGVMVTASS